MAKLLGKVNVPEGESGDWRVEKFTVSKHNANFYNLRAVWHPGQRTIEPGTYTKLMRGGQLVMSDTPAELRDHEEPVRKAKGNVIINGLGLGCVLLAVLKKPEVNRVRVIENSADVLNLIAPSYTDNRIEYIHANALEWRPPKGERVDVVWHDIWDDICAGNLLDMKRLCRAYGRRTDWQGCWARDQIW